MNRPTSFFSSLTEYQVIKTIISAACSHFVEWKHSVDITKESGRAFQGSV